MSSCCFCRERLQWRTQGTCPLWEPSLGNHSPSRHPRFRSWYEIFFWLHHAPVVLNKASHKCALMSSSNVNILKSMCYSFATFIPKLSTSDLWRHQEIPVDPVCINSEDSDQVGEFGCYWSTLWFQIQWSAKEVQHCIMRLYVNYLINIL